jgi:branched-chain amino acid transport system ATP-binding protein
LSLFLEVRQVSKSFGGLKAVNRVTLAVEKGQVVSLIGPNGAGKTTIFNLITGVFYPEEGDIFFNDHRITGMPPYKLCHLGLARSFQITNIFQGLTVFENIRLARQGQTRGFNLLGSISHLSQLNNEAEDILNLLGLWNQRDELAGNLSHGDQRYLEIGIALASQPSMLLLDEPTAGMTPMETRASIELIKRLREKVTIILIEHDIDLVFEVSDKIMVMHQGSLLAEGTPNEVKGNKAVQEAYLGEEV